MSEGICILNADDESCVQMVPYTHGQVVFFSLDENNPHIQKAIAEKKTAWYLKDGWIVCTKGGKTERFMPTAHISITINGKAKNNIANVLASLAAANEMGKIIEEHTGYFIIKKDENIRGRAIGETALLLEKGALKNKENAPVITTIIKEKEAFEKAWELSQTGDLLLLLFDQFANVEALFKICVPPKVS